MLQAEVKPETVLSSYLCTQNWIFELFICMNNETHEVLACWISAYSCSSNLPFLDSSAQDKPDSVVRLFGLQELGNLDFLFLEVNLQAGWNFKRLVIVMS